MTKANTVDKIICVFPRKTSFTPIDDYSFIGLPTLFIPEHDEVHISVTFTWDKLRAETLQRNWQDFTDKPVLIGVVRKLGFPHTDPRQR